jgi:hypothetical protein
MSARWAQVLAVPREAAGDGWRIALEDSELRFVPARDGRGDGLRAFDVRVRDVAAVRAVAEARGLIKGEEVILCGTSVRLVKA